MNFIKDPKDRQMLLELPANYRTTVMRDFLFQSFFPLFKRHFEFERPVRPGIRHAYFKWGDHDYDEFMIEIMTSLVPRRYFENDIIYEELDQILEMTFVLEGRYYIGFEINHKKKWVLAQQQGKIIGEYNVYFLKNSSHIYCCRE